MVRTYDLQSAWEVDDTGAESGNSDELVLLLRKFPPQRNQEKSSPTGATSFGAKASSVNSKKHKSTGSHSSQEKGGENRSPKTEARESEPNTMDQLRGQTSCLRTKVWLLGKFIFQMAKSDWDPPKKSLCL
ncbi:hypothetical protein Pyn_08072 [Prunus yedoensis var. nudiflora]|uniref:Uncharacterized protein n=1 Tax=Prunus yedoensis var. nudiflora TaxID=2094558 RepID=A0A314UZ85_PRUYE|nr:hypothetical protein Pyn_08072 [Prunus yedoensis var. nudiflora]